MTTTAVHLVVLYPIYIASCTDIIVEVRGVELVRVVFGVHSLAYLAESLRSCGYREHKASLYLKRVYKPDDKGLLSMEPSFLLTQSSEQYRRGVWGWKTRCVTETD